MAKLAQKLKNTGGSIIINEPIVYSSSITAAPSNNWRPPIEFNNEIIFTGYYTNPIFSLKNIKNDDLEQRSPGSISQWKAILSTANGVIFLGRDTGYLQKSLDSGQTFVNAISATRHWRGLSAYLNGIYVYSYTTTTGTTSYIAVSNNEFSSYTNTNGWNGSNPRIDIVSTNTCFFGSTPSGNVFYKSTDGYVWTIVDTGIDFNITIGYNPRTLRDGKIYYTSLNGDNRILVVLNDDCTEFEVREMPFAGPFSYSINDSGIHLLVGVYSKNYALSVDGINWNIFESPYDFGTYSATDGTDFVITPSSLIPSSYQRIILQ